MIDLRKCPRCGGGRITVHIKAHVRFVDGVPVALGAARYPDTVTPAPGEAAMCGDCLHNWRLTGPPASVVLDRFRPNHPAWDGIDRLLDQVIEYREEIQESDYTAAAASSAYLAAIYETGDYDDGLSRADYDDDEFGFFTSIWAGVIPDLASVNDLVNGGDLKGAGEQLDRLIADHMHCWTK